MNLTQKDWETLGYIRDAVRDTGRFPSLREACEALGVLSTGTVKYRLDRLIRAGEVYHVDSGARGFYGVVARPGCCAGCGQVAVSRDGRTARRSKRRPAPGAS